MSDRIVRYFDLGRLHASVRPELGAAFDEIVTSSAFVGAGASNAFEAEYARLTGRAHAIGVGSLRCDPLMSDDDVVYVCDSLLKAVR